MKLITFILSAFLLLLAVTLFIAHIIKGNITSVFDCFVAVSLTSLFAWMTAISWTELKQKQ